MYEKNALYRPFVFRCLYIPFMMLLWLYWKDCDSLQILVSFIQHVKKFLILLSYNEMKSIYAIFGWEQVDGIPPIKRGSQF